MRMKNKGERTLDLHEFGVDYPVGPGEECEVKDGYCITRFIGNGVHREKKGPLLLEMWPDMGYATEKEQKRAERMTVDDLPERRARVLAYIEDERKRARLSGR